MKTMCPKCPHFKTCEKPCYPVSKYLYERGEPFERGGVIYPQHKQIPISVCMKESHDGKRTPNDEEKLLSDQLESPFRHFEPGLKMTGIFIQRFFFRKSFKEISEMYEISESNATVTFSNALKIILENLELLDKDGRKDIAENHNKKVFRDRSKSIRRDKKWYILSRVFGFTCKEITEMEGDVTNKTVSSSIHRYDKQVKKKKFPKNEKYFILHNVFKMDPAIIAMVENTSKENVMQSIGRYAKRLNSSNYVFVEV